MQLLDQNRDRADTYHHGSSNAIYLGTDVIKGWMKKCQLDRTAALMFTYVLAHEYGHAIFERPNADVRSIMALYFMGYLTLKGQKRMTRDTHRSLNLPDPGRNGQLFEWAARICAAGTTLVSSAAAQGAPGTQPDQPERR